MYDANTLWNPTRARNFVKEFGGTPTKFEDNLAFLANKYRPGMHVKMFQYTINPLQFLRAFWPQNGSANSIKWYNDACRLLGSWVFYDLSSAEAFAKKYYTTDNNLEKYYKNLFGLV